VANWKIGSSDLPPIDLSIVFSTIKLIVFVLTLVLQLVEYLQKRKANMTRLDRN